MYAKKYLGYHLAVSRILCIKGYKYLIFCTALKSLVFLGKPILKADVDK